MEGNLKEVYFDQYCPTCENKDKPEGDDPCNECLDTPANVDSHKPINYKEKEG
jgi:hypothetical protein